MSATHLSLKTTFRPSQTLLSHHLLIRPLLAAVAPKKRTAISCLISGFDGGGVSDEFGGDLSIKRVKVDQEIDHSVDYALEDICFRAPELDMEISNPIGAVASTSDVHELPKERNDMKIREDKIDDNEDISKRHLIDKQHSVELANGDFSIVQLKQGGNVVAALARIGDQIQWPLAKDEAAVKLDAAHYFFRLAVPSEHGEINSESILNYGLTKAEKAVEQGWYGAVAERFSSEESSAAYWTTLAPNVEDYSGRAPRMGAKSNSDVSPETLRRVLTAAYPSLGSPRVAEIEEFEPQELFCEGYLRSGEQLAKWYLDLQVPSSPYFPAYAQAQGAPEDAISTISRKGKFDCSIPEFGESSRSCRKLKSSNLRSCSVKAIYAPVNSLRSGIWSIREDLQVPSSPYFPAYAQAQGPPPMVQERFMSVISQLFQYRIIRCGGAVDDDMANIIVSQLLYLDAVDPTKRYATTTQMASQRVRDIRERHKSGVIEIRVLRKWISKGKKEELCYQFIDTY
ncbi:hypothetical protein CASFOL_002424 [Castilleja foliolosa]|uniref:Uncharacterized protein n=1 Tax=Castilleja foliolosa TaxID=1961234 RepID=A0ABD3EEI3_9LAMI